MPAILATFLRCLLALALVANGGFAASSVHAHMSASPAGDSGAMPDMPCHGDDTDAAQDSPAQRDAPADCCGSQCACNCVLGSVLTTASPRVALEVPVQVIPALAAAPFVMTAMPRLLRPPIA